MPGESTTEHTLGTLMVINERIESGKNSPEHDRQNLLGEKYQLLVGLAKVRTTRTDPRLALVETVAYHDEPHHEFSNNPMRFVLEGTNLRTMFFLDEFARRMDVTTGEAQEYLGEPDSYIYELPNYPMSSCLRWSYALLRASQSRLHISRNHRGPTDMARITLCSDLLSIWGNSRYVTQLSGLNIGYSTKKDMLDINVFSSRGGRIGTIDLHIEGSILSRIQDFQERYNRGIVLRSRR